MAERPPRREEEEETSEAQPAAPPMPPAPPPLVQVDFERMMRYILEDRYAAHEEPEKIQEIKNLISDTSALAREFVDIYVKDGLSRIIHPLYGAEVLDTRLIEEITLMRMAVREAWEKARQLIRAGAPPQEVAKAVQRAMRYTRQAMLLARQLYDKLLTLYYINAPPRAAPPLRDAALGFLLLQ